MLDFLRRRQSDPDQTGDIPPPLLRADRPSIGLALGGGAARGFAHIGVLRTLIAKGLRPDVITGTSIGAVAGACYATDHLDAFEEWARNVTRKRMFRYFDFSFAGSGLISGSRIADRIAHEFGDVSFDDLTVRFAAIATEVGTGHEIWLTRGRIVDALRASYALPGIFPPVRIGGRWLMDGALVNPVPVSAARALGARLVIGVNLNAEIVGKGTTIHEHGPDEADELLLEAARVRSGKLNLFGMEGVLRRHFLGERGRPGISTVMVDAFNIILDRITRARLAGDPPDIIISPRLGRIGLTDFHRAEDAIALGAEAAEKALEPVADVIEALS